MAREAIENCGSCRYYLKFDPEEVEEEEHPEPDSITGVCRRYPPKLLSACVCRLSAYPEVSAELGWCGEYMPRT